MNNQTIFEIASNSDSRILDHYNTNPLPLSQVILRLKNNLFAAELYYKYADKFVVWDSKDLKIIRDTFGEAIMSGYSVWAAEIITNDEKLRDLSNVPTMSLDSFLEVYNEVRDNFTMDDNGVIWKTIKDCITIIAEKMFEDKELLEKLKQEDLFDPYLTNMLTCAMQGYMFGLTESLLEKRISN